MGLSDTLRILKKELSSEEWETRFLAVKRLASANVQQMFTSLAAKDREAVADLLIKLLDDDNSHVRSQAVAALGNLSWTRALDAVITALADPNEWVRIQVGEALSRIGDKSSASIVAQHLESENDPHVRATLVKTLGNIGDEKMLPVLLLYLEDSDGRVRANSVEALARLQATHRSLKEALFRLEHDPSNRVRANIAISLLSMGEDKGREILSEMIESEDEYMRASAAYAMGEIKASCDLKVLTDLLGDRSWLVRRNAVRSIVKFGIQDMSRLLKLLESENPQIRYGVLDVIRELGWKAARPSVIKLLDDESGEVRSKAEETLDSLDGF